MYESDKQEIKLRKRHERVGRRWRALKPKAKCCPDCYETSIGLNDSLTHRIKRFYLECEKCHWCGKSYPTIRLAVWSWNRQKSASASLYEEGNNEKEGS